MFIFISQFAPTLTWPISIDNKWIPRKGIQFKCHEYVQGLYYLNGKAFYQTPEISKSRDVGLQLSNYSEIGQARLGRNVAVFLTLHKSCSVKYPWTFYV